MSEDLSAALVALGRHAFDALRQRIGARWASLTPGERDLLEAIASDAAAVAFQALTDPEGARHEKAHVDAQLQNVKVAGQIAASKMLWETFEEILVHAGRILLGVL